MTEQVQGDGTTQNTVTDAQVAAAAAATATQANAQQAATTEGQGAGETAAPAATQGAPEAYVFTAPEGHAFDAGVLTVFEASARKHGLTQDAAQDLLTSVGPAIAERQKAAIEERTADMKKAWGEQAKADKEYGGDKLAENLAIAEAGLEAHGTPELKAFLKESGLSHNPEMVRLFYRLGKLSSPDSSLAQGQPTGTAKGAQAFFPASNMNP